MPEPQKVAILPCGRCGAAARKDEGIISPAHPVAPIRYRCSRDRACLQGPEGELALAVHGWNRVTQGWVGMEVLLALAKQIPDLEPQITKAMETRFKAFTEPKEKESKVEGMIQSAIKEHPKLNHRGGIQA